MSEFYTIVTQEGINELYNSMLQKRAFDAFYMAFGDSNGSYYEPEDDQAQLKNQKFKTELYAKGKNEKEGYLFFNAQIPPEIGDFTIREVGLLDSKDNLLAIAKYPETLKQKAESESDKTLSVELQIILSSNTINQIIIDNSGILATKDELETKANISLNNLNTIGKVKNSSPVFCFNSGAVDENGEAALLELNENSVKLVAPAIYTDGLGKTHLINEDLELDITNLENGTYSILVDENEGAFSLCAKSIKIFRQKNVPEEPSEGDLWLNLSVAPHLAYEFSSGVWVLTSVVEAGKLTIDSNSEGGG